MRRAEAFSSAALALAPGEFPPFGFGQPLSTRAFLATGDRAVRL
jgi:hypothetical protein